jgi:DNA-binding HxlR family transcriptional regulator
MSARSYEQACGLAFALDAVGERWGLLVVRELLCGPRRFGDLMAGLPGAATNTLASRLEELDRQGVIVQQHLPPPVSAAVYALTEKGKALEPAIIALVQWSMKDVGAAMAAKKRKLVPIRPAWLAIALKAFYGPHRFRAPGGKIGLVLPKGALTVLVEKSGLEIRDRHPGDKLAGTLTTTEDLVIGHCTGALGFPELLRASAGHDGDVEAISHVLAAFRIRVGPPAAK